MATIKSYTSREQSRKLAEILPLESADMFWYKDAVIKEANPRIMNYMQIPKLQSMYYSPCWSLAPLLDVLPRYIEFEGYLVYLDIYLTKNLGWVIEYSNNKEDFIGFIFNSEHLINACYEMIIKLHEQKLL